MEGTTCQVSPSNCCVVLLYFLQLLCDSISYLSLNYCKTLLPVHLNVMHLTAWNSFFVLHIFAIFLATLRQYSKSVATNITANIAVVNYCRAEFNFELPVTVINQRTNKFVNNEIIIVHVTISIENCCAYDALNSVLSLCVNCGLPQII